MSKKGRPSKAVLKHREEARRYYDAHRDERLAYQKNYNIEHRDERSARGKAWRKAHPRILAECKRADYQKHRTKRLETVRIYNEIHKLEKAAISRKWRRDYPRQAKALNIKSKHDYRARLAEAEGSFTSSQFYSLCKEYNYCCLGCGRSKKQLLKINRVLIPDHIKPLARGGSNSIENIQPLCHAVKGGRGGCNNSKHAKEIDYRNTELALYLIKIKQNAKSSSAKRGATSEAAEVCSDLHRSRFHRPLHAKKRAARSIRSVYEPLHGWPS